MVEHIEKMVEVRLRGSRLRSLRGAGGNRRSGQSRLVVPGHCPGSHHQCQVQGPTLSLQKARGAADGWGWDGGTEKGGGGGDRKLPTAETPPPPFMAWTGNVGRVGPMLLLSSPPPCVPLCTPVCVPELRCRWGRPHLTGGVPDHPWELSLPQRLWRPRPEPVRRPGGRGRGKAGSLPLGF